MGAQERASRVIRHRTHYLSRPCIERDVALVATLFVLYGLHQGIFRAVGKAFASDFVPEPLRASGIGWYSATVGVLQLIASVTAGQIWDRIGHVAVFYYGAAFAAVGIVALLLVVVQRDDFRC